MTSGVDHLWAAHCHVMALCDRGCTTCIRCDCSLRAVHAALQTGAEMDEAQLAELQILRERVVEVQALQVTLHLCQIHLPLHC